MFTLRPLRYSDAESLSKHANNHKIWEQLRDAFPNPYTIAHAREFIRMHSAVKPISVWGIEIQKEIVGCIGYHPLEDVYRINAEIGYWLAEEYWGKGITTKACKQIVEIIFETTNMQRICAGVFSTNPSSMRVLEKAGFRAEGIGLDALIKNGKLLNEHRYALLSRDFSASLSTDEHEG